MDRREEITQLVFEVIDDLNAEQAADGKLEKSLDAVLLGRFSKLDSLGIVNLVVATEEKIDERFGVSVSLADEQAMSEEKSPLSTIGTLVDYISQVVGEHSGG